MLAIWVMSSTSQPPSAHWLPFRDKGAHFLEYALLAGLLSHAFYGSFPGLRLRALFLSAALCAASWGLLDEIHQAFVPGRSADPRDLMADTLGALTGAGVYLLIARVRRKRSAQPAG
jgi:VanZ family protein